MSKKLFSLLGFLFGLALTSVVTFAAPANVPVREEMGGLYATLSELLPIVLNKAAFEDPKNKRVIAGHMNQLSALTKKMAANSARFADQDPSIPYIMERFTGDIHYAIESWNRGDRVIPRNILQNITDYCISCHTRTSKGVHFHEMIPPAGFKSMPALSKADYLAATRQYVDALKQYENVLVAQPLTKVDGTAWASAVKRMLAISVRVENDANLTLELLSRIQDVSGSVPSSDTAMVAEWRRQAKAWVLDKTPAPKNAAEKERLAIALVRDADRIEKDVHGGAVIQHLRASNLFHQLLGQGKQQSAQQELLWQAGQSAQYLRDINLWTLQDIYFESCIRVGGKKELSQKCFDALKDSMVQSYGVSSSGTLPEFVKVQLDRLKNSIK